MKHSAAPASRAIKRNGRFETPAIGASTRLFASVTPRSAIGWRAAARLCGSLTGGSQDRPLQGRAEAGADASGQTAGVRSGRSAQILGRLAAAGRRLGVRADARLPGADARRVRLARAHGPHGLRGAAADPGGDPRARPARRVAIPAALSRVLRRGGRRDPRSAAPADNSAMDGYAVRAADLAGASARAAGASARRLRGGRGRARRRARSRAGEAARILTGAPLPAGRRQRRASGGRGARRRRRSWCASRRARASTCASAARTCAAASACSSRARVIGPAEVGMLAALGRSVVGRAPAAARRDPLGRRRAGRARRRRRRRSASSRRTRTRSPRSVASSAPSPSISASRATIPRISSACFRAGLRADVLVSSAGVSVGDRDYVRPVLEKLGCTLVFWGVKIKPGFPLCFGRFASGRRAAGVRPARESGLGDGDLRAVRAAGAAASWPAIRVCSVRCVRGDARRAPREAARAAALRARRARARAASQVLARSTGTQSSGALRSMTLASGLLIFPARGDAAAPGRQRRRAGARRELLPLPPSRASDARGRGERGAALATIAAALLTGGSGSRLGRDKSRVPLAGRRGRHPPGAATGAALRGGAAGRRRSSGRRSRASRPGSPRPRAARCAASSARSRRRAPSACSCSRPICRS